MGQKMLSKINSNDCNGVRTHNHLVRKKNTQLHLDTAPVLSKEFLEIQATTEFRFSLKGVGDMIRTYSQMNPSIENVKQRLLSCTL